MAEACANGLLADVKLVIKSLVVSSAKSLSLPELNNEYRNMEGKFIPYWKFGYKSLYKFLCGIPDAVRVYGTERSATVGPMSNLKTNHIMELVKNQKRHRPRRRYNTKKQTDNAEKSSHATVGQQLPAGKVQNNVIPKNETGNAKDGKKVTYRRYKNRKTTAADVEDKSKNQPVNNTVRSRKDLFKCFELVQAGKIAVPENYVAKSALKTDKQCPVPELNKNIQNTDASASASANETNQPLIVFAKRDVSSLYNDKPSTLKSTRNYAAMLKTYPTATPRALRKRNIPSVFLDSCDEDSNDLDEAVPSCAINHLVLQVDIPIGAVGLDECIPEYEMPGHLIVGAYVRICVSEVHNPFKFWFQLFDESDELEKLMFRIENFYKGLEDDLFLIPRECIVPGQTCAAVYGGHWYRGQVVTRVNGKDEAKILFVDYGTVIGVNCNQIKYLRSLFAYLPYQALRGSLSHVVPRHGHWSRSATDYFLNIVRNKVVFAKITEIDVENRSYYMVICDTTSHCTVQVNNSLVRNNHAAVYHNWYEPYISINNGRAHHVREDYPTFSMLEQE